MKEFKMELLVLNTNFEAVGIVDSFESLIWTERYNGYGDFEVCLPVNDEMLSLLQEDYYLWINESTWVMIIEDLKITTDAENVNRLIVTGRSIESILDRRIIWDQTILTGDFQTGILKLLNENVISPSISDRTIANFIFEASTDPLITDLTIDAQFTRPNLYESIQALCVANNVGFGITLSATNQFVFKLYAGADRSYDQIVNPYLVFSPNFDNILNSQYAKSKKSSRTLTVVAGEGEGIDRKTTVVGSGTSLARRELYTDARDLSMKTDGGYMSDADYLAQLVQRGTEDLSKYIVQQAFEGQADTTNMFTYGEDFFLGDVVQIDSGYGISAKSRVMELIRSQSTTGIEVYPTFTMVDVNQFASTGVLIPGNSIPPVVDTAAQILAKLLTVDGIGSGLDADLLDNKHSSDFINQGYIIYNSGNMLDLIRVNAKSGTYLINPACTNRPGTGWLYCFYNCLDSSSGVLNATENNTNRHFVNRCNGGSWSGWSETWNSNSDGIGSGLDSDLLDGKHASEFAPNVFAIGQVLHVGLSHFGVLNYSYQGTPTNGILITTNMPWSSGWGMPCIIIEGYSYGDNKSIGIQLVFYTYQDSMNAYSAHNFGGITPPIWIAKGSNGNIAIWIDQRQYYVRFAIRCINGQQNENNANFEGWTASDAICPAYGKVQFTYM